MHTLGFQNREKNMKKKKRLIIFGSIACAILLTLVLLLIVVNKKSYALDLSEFNSVLAFEEQIDLDDLSIINQRNGKKIQIDQSMIIFCDSSNTIGQKVLIIEYDGFRFEISYTVKYKVEFVAKGEVVNTQFVNSANEITLPENPSKDGYEFISWNQEIPSTINHNIQIEAIFSSTTLPVPQLEPIDAVYGDNLGMITLPSGANGRWVFVDSPETKVGNAGTNEFNVKFVPSTSELVEKYSKVTINVAQKQLNFTINQASFVYDGKPHFPEYTLSENVSPNVKVLNSIVISALVLIFPLNLPSAVALWQFSQNLGTRHLLHQHNIRSATL